MTELTIEELKLLTALQPVIREKMGVWQEGDWYMFTDSPTLFLVDCTNVDDLNERPQDYPELLRLPLPIDPWHPERGLWGMIDWERFYPKFGVGGNIKIEQWVDDELVFTTDWQSPCLALLKALAQEGVKI